MSRKPKAFSSAIGLALALLAPNAFSQVSKGPMRPGQSPSAPSQARGFAPAPPASAMAPAPRRAADTRSNSALDPILSLSKKSSAGFGETSTLKFVYQIATDKVHLVDVNLYDYHYQFASARLGYKKSSEVFNKNYQGPLSQREFVLGTIVLLKDPNAAFGYKALLEIWNGDNLDSQGLETVMSKVEAQLPKGIEVLFHPSSLDQEKIATEKFVRSRYILTKELVGSRTYLVFNKAEAYGYIRFASTQAGVEDAFDLTTIAVYDHVPNELGLVGGVITAEPQTPLSHVNVKSMNRNTMNIYLKDARNVLKQYENLPVHITLDGDRPTITVMKDKAKADEMIAQFWSQRRPKLNGQPVAVLDPAYDKALIPLNTYYQKLPNKATHAELVRRVGAKAANLALLNALTDRLGLNSISSPASLGVPFNFYEQFINLPQVGLDPADPKKSTTVLAMTTDILNRYELLNPKIIHPIEKVREALTAIRAIYAKAQVPPTILSVFKKAIIEDTNSPVHISKHPRLRLRSSTNSEDLEGFTGAGLYDSDGINLYKKNDNGTYDRSRPLAWDEIEKRLKRVLPALYSSVWNERAFQEREWYQMNGSQHLAIKVGLAFHGAFPAKGFEEDGELANGVAVTTNIYNPKDWGKVYINAQHYDLAVTNPPDAKDLEELGEPTNKVYSTDELLVTSFTADDTLNEKPDTWSRWPIEILSQTSIKNGERVLKGQEALKLARAFWLLNQQMAKIYGKSPDEFSTDIEWKIYGPKRNLMIKQARPFVAPLH